MLSNKQLLMTNQETYQNLYRKNQGFLRYPADWVIRFHNMYLRPNIPGGRLLDYGCGAGNNSYFFIEQGYEVYGIDVADAALPLIKRNLESRHLDASLIDRFSIVPPDNISLPFENDYFDVVVSNQVLYYLASEEQIRKVCKELSRVLRPGGAVFFTVMGPPNYLMTHHTKQIHNGETYEVRTEDPSYRLLVYLVRDQDHLKRLFSDFDCITTGHFSQGMFDMSSNFHWIFVGRKPH